MAGRLKYYVVLRQIHLISSIIILTCVFVFLITGIVIANRNLFEVPESETSTLKVLVEKPMNGNPGDYSDYLKEKLNFKGRQIQRQENNGNWIFEYNFQGKNHRVTLTPAQDTLYIRSSIQKMNLVTFSTKLHHMRGFSGGWEYTLWAVLYDLTAVAFIVFAVTGILMWFKIRMRYQAGWWFLLAGTIIPVAIILLFLFWR